MPRTLRILGLILSVTCLCAIIYLSLAQGVKVPEKMPAGDKGAHFIAYAVLAFLLFFCFASPSRKDPVKKNILPSFGAWALASIIGYALELLQPRFGRAYDILDLAADSLGALLGVLAGFVCVLFCVFIENHRARNVE